MNTAVVIGGTGLTGQEIVRQLIEHRDYQRVICLVRTPFDLVHPKLEQIRFDFENPDPTCVQGNHLYCAMGTTLRKAGSKAAQYKIDCTYPSEIGKIARKNGFTHYLLVSSIGADATSGNFYLRTKGELEANIQSLNFETFIVVRPSFLLGKRTEFRLAEQVGIVLARVFAFLIPKKYRGIEASKVAKGLISRATSLGSGSFIVESDQLH